jgi:hypothetical protein
MVDGVGRSAQHPDLLVANLVAVAVGAVQNVSTPALADAWDIRQLVTKTGGHEYSTRGQLLAAGKQDLEPRFGTSQDFRDGALDDGAAVTLHLVPPGGQEVVRRKAVARKESMHVGCGRVPWRPGVNHSEHAPGPGQHQSRRQAGSAAADHHHVVFVHVIEPARATLDRQQTLLFLGRLAGMGSWTNRQRLP